MTNIISRRHAKKKCDFCQAITEGISFYLPGSNYAKLSLCEACLKAYPKACPTVLDEDTPPKEKQRNPYKRYNLTLSEYEQMLSEQQELCAACGQPEKGRSTRNTSKTSALSVDHCHTTGKVRGLLCRKCNMALGLLDEDQGKILALAEYIKRYQ